MAEGDADVNCTLGEYSSTMLWGNEADPPRLVQTHPVLCAEGCWLPSLFPSGEYTWL